MKLHSINVGELFVTDEALTISTVVGSCIALCAWDQRLGIGGMIHYSIPCGEFEHTDAKKGTLHCGDYAIRALFKSFKEYGSSPEDIQVKLIGGACQQKIMGIDVGERNAKLAHKLCARFGIPIVKEAIGGHLGRRVRFDPLTGDLMIQTLRETPTQIHPQATGPIKVLIVDDSKVIQSLFKVMLSKDPRFEIFGVAESPLAAEALMKNSKPDVITLDMQMPEMDGLTYLQKYLPRHGLPVIMVSGAENTDGQLALQALELGAFDFIPKPSAEQIKEFTPMLKEKIEAAVDAGIRRIPTGARGTKINFDSQLDSDAVVVIGSSTGGTVALAKILTSLPDQIPPIIIVQHIPEGFSDLFARRVNSLVRFDVKEAENNDLIMSGKVWIAPGGKQMKLKRQGDVLRLVVTDDPPVNKHKPSVDYFFDSVARHLGPRAVAFILTGMGRDGARGMLKIHEAGGRTVAQDKASCVVFGMPREAIALGAAQKIVSLEQMPLVLMQLCSKKSSRQSQRKLLASGT